MNNITADPEDGSTNGVELVKRAADNQTAAAPRAEEKNIEVPTVTASNGSSNTTAGGDNDAKEDVGISLEELIYGASSFHAVVKPVSVTMILAALAVIYINTDATKAAGERALNMYQVYTINEGYNEATSLGLGLVNALVLVCGIGAMTFLLVFLYKYRCMKCLIGYMVLASTMLLGFLGGQMFVVAINKYQLAIDQISFYFTMFNFSIVGTVAIFYMKGIPMYITQAYLVVTSVIVAWQLSYFGAWMAWALLIMLALYDLFAVLTPCGPLKALVNLMSKDDAPAMPGLLYEARLPENATRPGRKQNNISDSNDQPNGDSSNESGAEAHQNAESRTVSATVKTIAATDQTDVSIGNGVMSNAETNNDVPPLNRETETREVPSAKPKKGRSTRRNAVENESASSQGEHHTPSESSLIALPTQLQESASPSITLPLAIAKIYKLPIVSPCSLGVKISLDASSPRAYLQQEFSATELQTDVEVKLPRNGGRIETTYKKGEPRYVVYNRDGEVKRTLLVDENGKVMEITPGQYKPDKEDNTIKLGLGDFIFYSVLVSKAAENGFAAFVTCFLSILTGLGGTLVLLAVYHKALPALPISIFLAVVMFVLTIYSMEPWARIMWTAGPYYV